MTVAIAPVVLCGLVLAARGFGNSRLLMALVLWTAAWYAAAVLLSGSLQPVALSLLLVAFGIGWFLPERLGLLQIGGPEAEADHLFRQLSPGLRSGSVHADAALAFAASLAPGTFPVPDGSWAVAAALFRQSLLQHAGAQAWASTPTALRNRAARSFWRAGLTHGMAGWRHHPNPWDEGIALRCYQADFDAVIPRQALKERGLVPLGGWDGEAERVIERLREIPLADDVMREGRRALAAAMADSLAVVRGDRSEEAVALQRLSAERMIMLWAAIVERERAFTQTDPASGAPGV